ncbi:MAG: MFS transporter [Sphingomonadaceae bacterium]|nr:MFS transporter [Sphingomonadaceae bacterium]
MQHAPTLSTPRRLRSIAAGCAGNLVEWYDWYAYSFLALYFAPSFFPKGDPLAQQLDSAAVFAVGFLARPVGGWWLGWITDTRGRKAGLTASILLMGAGSLMIALCPPASSIGLAAPVLLVVARLVQGLSVGGEFGASATYIAEMAPQGRKGLWGSFQYMTLVGGQLIALMTLLALQAVLSEAEIAAWGWRVPFALGALLSLGGLWLRRSADETPNFEALAAADRAVSPDTIARERGGLWLVIALTACTTVAFYSFTTYMQKYLVTQAGWARTAASETVAVALAIYLVTQPLFGALSDRIGRRGSILCAGTLGTLFAAPLMAAIGRSADARAALPPLLAALGIIGFWTAISGLVKAELFPAKVRGSGVAIGHSIAVALFGGTTEWAALKAQALGHPEWFRWYVAACFAVLLAFGLFQPQRLRTARIEAA